MRVERDWADRTRLADQTRKITEAAKEVGGASEVAVRHTRVRQIDALLGAARAQRDLWLAQIELDAALGDTGEDPEERGAVESHDS